VKGTSDLGSDVVPFDGEVVGGSVPFFGRCIISAVRNP